MEYLILLVFGTLCCGLMMVMYQKNAELFSAIKKNEAKMKDFEKYVNPGEHDTMIRQRMSTTESRITNMERHQRTQEDQFTIVTQKLHSALDTVNKIQTGPGNSGSGLSAEQVEILTNQITFVNDRVNNIGTEIQALNNAQLYLAGKALLLETNVCVFSQAEACPPGMKKVGTFGVIEHSAEHLIPSGYFKGGKFNDNGWDWLHGGMCCVETMEG
jgi:hypothetical protein